MFSGGHDTSASLLPDNKAAIIEPVQGGGGYEQTSKGWQSLPVTIKRGSTYKPSINHGSLQKFQMRWKQTLGPNIPSRRRPRQDPHVIVGILNIISCPTYIVAPLRGDEEAASDVFAWASNLMETDTTNHIIFMGPLLDNTKNTLIEQGISSLMSLYAGHILYVCNKETELPSLNGIILHAMPNTSKQVALGFVPEHENVYHRSSRNLDCLKVDTIRIPISKESEAESSRSIFNIEFDNPKTIKHREKDFDNKYISDDMTFKAIPGWVTQIVYKDNTMDGGKLSMEEMIKAKNAAKENPPTVQNPYPLSPTENRERPTFNSVAGEVAPAPPSKAAANVSSSTGTANAQPSKVAAAPSTADLPGESTEAPPPPSIGFSQIGRQAPPPGGPRAPLGGPRAPPPPSTGISQLGRHTPPPGGPRPPPPPSTSEEYQGEEENEGNEEYQEEEENEGDWNETSNLNESEYNIVTVDSIQYKIRKNADAAEEWKVGKFTRDEEQLLIKQGYLYPKEIYPEILKVFRDQKCDSEAGTMLSKNCGLLRYLQANNLHNKTFKLNNKVHRRGNSSGSQEYENEEDTPEENVPEENVPEENQNNSEGDANSKTEVSITTPVETATETATKTPVQTVREAPVETVRETPVETVRETPVQTVREAPVQTVREAPVETATEAPVETVRETHAKGRPLLPHQRIRSPLLNARMPKEDTATTPQSVDKETKGKKGLTWRNEAGKGPLENVKEIERRPEKPNTGGSRKSRQRKSKNKTVKLRFIY